MSPIPELFPFLLTPSVNTELQGDKQTIFLSWPYLQLFTSKLSLQNSKLVPDDYEIKHTLLRQPFEWQPKVSEVQLGEGNSTKKQICRNSVQGKSLIVDERGNPETLSCCILVIKMLLTKIVQVLHLAVYSI